MDTNTPVVLNVNSPRLGLWATAVLVLATLLIVASRTLLSARQDPREPPLIKPGIPIIGHILGIFRYGTQYYSMVNQPYNYPIYTLPTPGMKQYIVTSPTIAAQLQRGHKDLTFYGAIIQVNKRLTGLPQAIMDKFDYNMDGHLGRDKGIMPVMHDMLANVLGRGPYLHELTMIQLNEFSEALNSMSSSSEVNLQHWLQQVFAVANIRTIYGPDSPMDRDPTLVKSFWDFENGLLGLIIDVVPWLTTRAAYIGRERMVAGLVEYLRRGAHHKASRIIQERVRINLEYGNTIEEAGRSELVVCFAILGNAVPSTFWVIVDIFSRPQLLADVRAELLQRAVRVDKATGAKVINVSTIKSSCPLFVSCYRETLRLIGNLASIRYVYRDTVIGGQFLKGGSMIQMPGAVIHHDPQVWGNDSLEFNPRRFMKKSAAATIAPTGDPSLHEVAEEHSLEEPTATSLPPGVPSAAYRLFGGGSVICPGRHFAQSEILAFVAGLVLAFDVQSMDGGVLRAPEKDTEGIPLTVLKPKRDIRVQVTRREADAGVRWKMVV